MHTEKEIEIIDVLDKIRPYIQRDGGDIEFVEFKDGIVYVKMLGACVGCGFVDDTISGAVEAILLDEVEDVIGVYVVEDEQNNNIEE